MYHSNPIQEARREHPTGPLHDTLLFKTIFEGYLLTA